ncbi:hypothetical protein KVT40_004779 [Elsinoe batatas]|uniref:Uncharacterized protein n=1 Tax=Elsinoe batatas TaxID=2601811 RepID=A0A8K0KZX7_9PEZI|nr:hypothetical protein KVT40_004779 [Elsinoe batatas]
MVLTQAVDLPLHHHHLTSLLPFYTSHPLPSKMADKGFNEAIKVHMMRHMSCKVWAQMSGRKAFVAVVEPPKKFTPPPPFPPPRYDLKDKWVEALIWSGWYGQG